MSYFRTVAAVALLVLLVEAGEVTENGYPIQWEKAPSDLSELPTADGVTVINPWDFRHRMAMYRVLLKETDQYMGSMGPGPKESPLWVFPMQLGWKLKTGRLADPTGASTCGHAEDPRVDTNTSHRTLCFSEGYRKITNKGVILACPDCPERFDGYPNVLCKGGLSGRHYWEAECSGREVTIAVSYKGIRRKGRGSDCRFGYNSQSWRLHCSPSRCYFRHGNRQTEIPLPGSSRIGVYLDHSEGILSFYNVSDGMTLLHREQTTFSEPVYPGFGIATDSAVTLYEL